jgi:hypothetical protein
LEQEASVSALHEAIVEFEKDPPSSPLFLKHAAPFPGLTQGSRLREGECYLICY